MDSLIAASARALATGDALGALKRIALREDPPALALRGTAMAQLGEHVRARELLQRAARGFGAHEALARARCTVADAEVALAMRDLQPAPRALATAAATLERHGDPANAAHARLIAVRRLLLLGRLGEARGELRRLDGALLPPALAAIAGLATAELALRALRSTVARAALAQARAAAGRARIPALIAEVDAIGARLQQPVARRISADGEHPLQLHDVEALFASGALVVDGCRRGLRVADAWLPLARRPVLFALAQSLAAAWPGDAERDALIAAAFRIRHADETHRARLRVELGRLRALAEPWTAIDATARGFALVPHEAREVAVLAPPIEGEDASLLALLADGEAWSTSALALALGTSQRSVQRALATLESGGQVRASGGGRTRRWLAAPPGGFATTLLLPATLPAA
ncbi:helix-turn-helix domain-containing protein [Luteimonas viscosa]|uniref:Helix-turn-helix domain-containing protein n=1 Tax=Luteimonas viscosa TaxID=1132694 RepID=A0A5D4XNI2_9GAMM|nr:helix-turn-helix domain-containing protein [Luteimonas viscosa]TYT25515.1 helix-turn-helix domain-containing protein [Luteimonas viscosa]